MRKKILKSIYEVVKSTVSQTAVDTSEIDFVYTKVKKSKDIKKWDRELGNYELIPHHTVKYIDSLFEEDEKNQLKRIITRISVKIMEINLEIWKYRCKILYSGNAALCVEVLHKDSAAKCPELGHIWLHTTPLL